MKKEQDYEDDGRTVADMSGVDTPSVLRGWFGLRTPPGDSSRKRTIPETDRADRPGVGSMQQEPEISPDERRMWTFAAIRAALLVALVYIGAIGGAIALMLLLWNH